MNFIFTVIFIASTAMLAAIEPQGFLPALLDGATRAASLCVALLASYAVWSGVMKLWEKSGIARGLSGILRPLLSWLLGTRDERVLSAAGMNVATNMLGLSGAATPYGIQTAALLGEQGGRRALCLFFVINAASLQLIPTSVITLRAAMNSRDAAGIVLPTLAASLFSLLFSILCIRLFVRDKRENQADFSFVPPLRNTITDGGRYAIKNKSTGAGTR